MTETAATTATAVHAVHEWGGGSEWILWSDGRLQPGLLPAGHSASELLDATLIGLLSDLAGRGRQPAAAGLDDLTDALADLGAASTAALVTSTLLAEDARPTLTRFDEPDEMRRRLSRETWTISTPGRPDVVLHLLREDITSRRNAEQGYLPITRIDVHATEVAAAEWMADRLVTNREIAADAGMREDALRQARARAHKGRRASYPALTDSGIRPTLYRLRDARAFLAARPGHGPGRPSKP
jgi:hypothetical protein